MERCNIKLCMGSFSALRSSTCGTCTHSKDSHFASDKHVWRVCPSSWTTSKYPPRIRISHAATVADCTSKQQRVVALAGDETVWRRLKDKLALIYEKFEAYSPYDCWPTQMVQVNDKFSISWACKTCSKRHTLAMQVPKWQMIIESLESMNATIAADVFKFWDEDLTYSHRCGAEDCANVSHGHSESVGVNNSRKACHHNYPGKRNYDPNLSCPHRPVCIPHTCKKPIPQH